MGSHFLPIFRNVPSVSASVVVVDVTGSVLISDSSVFSSVSSVFSAVLVMVVEIDVEPVNTER